ncbi:hypothetical protein SCALM49S_08929 [Streptomyces californicus]
MTEVTRPRYRGSASVWTRAPVTVAVIPLASPMSPPNATAEGRAGACPRATAPAAVTHNAPDNTGPARGTRARTVRRSAAAAAPTLNALAIHPMPAAPQPRSSARSTRPAATGPLKRISLRPITAISGASTR